MNRRVIVLAVVLLVSFSMVITGILFIHLGGNEGSAGKLYTFPLSVEGQTYVVSIKSNYSYAPEVSYFGLLKSVYFDFRGDPENAFCNITIPTNLIWGELSLYAKGYKMSKITTLSQATALTTRSILPLTTQHPSRLLM